ncbi:MAG: hypothetical protein ACRBFS_21865 [Aureispira sp.]
MATKDPFPVDELVKKLLTDKNTVPTDIIQLTGFIGKSTTEEKIIFYLDALLRQSLEISKEDILHTVKLTKTQSPIGGTMIWLNKASQYLYGNVVNPVQEQRIAQQYLGGNIYQQYAAQAQGANPAQPQPICCPQH